MLLCPSVGYPYQPPRNQCEVILLCFACTFLLLTSPCFFASINDKIVETLSSNGVTSENETIHTPPPSFNSIQSWGEYGSQVTYSYMLFEQQLSLA